MYFKLSNNKRKVLSNPNNLLQKTGQLTTPEKFIDYNRVLQYEQSNNPCEGFKMLYEKKSEPNAKVLIPFSD